MGARSRRGETGKVAFHIGGEDRHAGFGQVLGKDLQGDGLARPGRAGDQAVPIGAFQHQNLFGFALADENGFDHPPLHLDHTRRAEALCRLHGRPSGWRQMPRLAACLRASPEGDWT